MAIEVFNRYEHKYMIDKETFEKVLKVLDEHMDMDSHNQPISLTMMLLFNL